MGRAQPSHSGELIEGVSGSCGTSGRVVESFPAYLSSNVLGLEFFRSILLSDDGL